MIHANNELNRKIKEKPTRVATEELQLQDFVNADAYDRALYFSCQ